MDQSQSFQRTTFAVNAGTVGCRYDNLPWFATSDDKVGISLILYF